MMAAAAVLGAMTAVGAAQQAAVPAGGGFQMPSFGAPTYTIPPMPASTAITPNGSVVEDVIARVNDQVITRTEYERSEQQLEQEAQQTHMSEADYAERQRTMLRDMIDQQLLLSKGKELGITGDAETVRRLDDIRKQNHLDSMEALEHAASQQGVNFEDFKNNIRNNVITQQVVRDEVGRRLQMTHAQEETYYAAHQKDFQQPEQIHLSEILIPTPDAATDAQLAAAQAKADEAEAKIKAGTSFADVAKKYSGGPTAAAGGDLGDFKRGMLGDVLENATFSLQAGGVTAPIRTRQGYVILRVDSHQDAGTPPLSAVESQVQEAMYLDELQPALRAYLTTAREQAYVDIKPGFVDAGAAHDESKPVFTSYVPPAEKKKQLAKQRLEQERDARAQVQLASAKQRAAEKAAAAAAKHHHGQPGVQNVAMPLTHHVREVKVRYGQTPKISQLPAPPSAVTTTSGGALKTPSATAGTQISPNESTTTISNGTGADDDATQQLAPAPTHKTRYTARQKDIELAKANTAAAKAADRAHARPLQATSQETADEKVQAAPLGLNGNTAPKKKKHHKGDRKERLTEAKPTPVVTTAIAPTVNPTLAATPAGLTPLTQTDTTKPNADSKKPSADRTSLPPSTATPDNALPEGHPIPPAVPGPQTPQ
jgi:peptidyl-prolyl cis-trans isomerase SurA